MKILTLIIQQKWFDEIIKGNKKQEFRELRPRSEKKYRHSCKYPWLIFVV